MELMGKYKHFQYTNGKLFAVRRVGFPARSCVGRWRNQEQEHRLGKKAQEYD